MKINYKNREIDLDKCESIKAYGDGYAILHRIEEKPGKGEITFIQLDRTEDTDEVEKVDIHVVQNNVDIINHENEMSPKKQEFFRERAEIRRHQEEQNNTALENRLKALEDLISTQAAEIQKLKNK